MKNSVLLLILWLFAGIIVLTSRDVTKIQYACVWSVLLLKYFEEILRKAYEK